MQKYFINSYQLYRTVNNTFLYIKFAYLRLWIEGKLQIPEKALTFCFTCARFRSLSMYITLFSLIWSSIIQRNSYHHLEFIERMRRLARCVTRSAMALAQDRMPSTVRNANTPEMDRTACQSARPRSIMTTVCAKVVTKTVWVVATVLKTT